MQAITKPRHTATISTPRSTSFVYPFFGCLIYGFFSDYFLLCAVGGFVLSIIVKELWKPFIPAALLYFFIFQWAQVFTVVPYMDFLQGNIDHYGNYVDIHLNMDGPQFLVTMSLLQLGLMALAVGFFLRKVKGINAFSVKRASLQLKTKKVLLGFFISTLIFPTLLAVTRGNASLNQLLESATVIRKVFLILLIFILFTKRDRLRPVIIGVLVVEFILGFTGFFSDFKEILLFVLVVYLTVNRSLKPATLLRLIPGVFFLVFVLIFWSYVKPNYREFVSGGSRQQVVVVSKEEALNYLWENLKSFDAKSLSNGVEILLERIETMTLYFKAYERVPSIIPHTAGQNTMQSVNFLLLPRSWYPDKGILDPSTKATYYTGVKLATAEEGTSIAMGYFPDFYIDFGIYGMIAPLLLLAVFIGWASKKILQQKKFNLLFNYALLIGAVFTSGTLDSDLTFLLGVFRNFVVLFIIGNWVLFPWLNRFVSNKESE